MKDEHHDHDHETHPQTPGHDTPKTLISQTLILHDKDEDHEKAKPLDKESKANPQNKQLEILTNPFGPKEPIEKEKDKERENITKIVKQPSLKSDKKKTETVIQIEKQKTTNLDDLKIEDFHTTHNADTHSDHQIDHNDTHGLLKKPTWHYY